MAFKGENTLRQYNPIGLTADTISIRYQKTWGATNQTGVQSAMTMTVQTLVDNYSQFATGLIPMHIIYSPQDVANKEVATARLYEINFAAKA